jgi:type VI secretion system VgrG family protein
MDRRSIADTEVRIETADGIAYEVARLEGHEEVSRLFDFTLTIVAKDGVAIDSDALPGSAATIVFSADGQDVRRIPGMIASVQDMLDTETVSGTLKVRVVPRLWMWTLREACEVFVDQSVPDVARIKLERLGLTDQKDFQFRLRSQYSKREFIVQYKESDLNFVSRLLEHIGISFFFEEHEGRDVLVITDHPTGLSTSAGPVEVPFRARGEHKDVYELVSSAKVIPNHYVVRDYNYRTPQMDLVADVTLPVGVPSDVVEYGGHFKTQKDGVFLATVRAEERMSSRKVYEGKSDLATLAAGEVIKLVDHPRGNLELFVTRVEHATVQAVGTVSAAGEVGYKNSFRAIPKGVHFRPARVTPKPRVHGVITGIIDSQSESQYAVIDAQGRYQVRFLFDEGENDAGNASHPVRMAQPHAGPGYGMHFPLRPGVEVMLTCIDGDPDRPIIAGTVPNPQTASPVVGANAPRNIIRTGGGNEINIDDTDGSHRIKMMTPHRNTVFQLGAPNEAEAGAVLTTAGAWTTSATSGTSVITSFNAAFNGWWKWSTAGNVSLKAEKPDAMAIAAAGMAVLDQVTALAANALTLHTNIRKAENAVLAQKQSEKDVDTAKKKDALDKVQADMADPGSPNNLAVLLQQYKATKSPAPAPSVTVTQQAPPPPPPPQGQPAAPAKAVLAASGTPTTSTIITITITHSAANLAAGTATMTYTLDFEGSPQTVQIPQSGVYVIPGLGVTLTFADGAFVKDDTYKVECKADYIAQYTAAQGAIAKDIKTRDSDRDAVYLLQRQQATDPALSGQLNDSITAANLTLWLDNRVVAIDQRNLQQLRDNVAKDLADAKAANPQDAAKIALLQKILDEIDNYNKAASDYSDAVNASARARKDFADDAFDMANNPDEVNIARTQQAIVAEKGLTALISMAMGIWGTVKSFTAKYKANSAWTKLGASLKDGKPRFETRPEAAFGFNALRSPLATVSSEHSTSIGADRKLLLSSAMIGVYASRPAPAVPPDPVADPVGFAAYNQQLLDDAALGGTAAATAATAKAAAKAAGDAVKAADEAWDAYVKAKGGILRLDKWAKWAALNTTARSLINAANEAADAAAKANSLAETGILAMGADDHLSLSSKRLLEVTSGDKVYLTAETGLDAKVTNGNFIIEGKTGNSELRSLEAGLVLSAGPDANGAGNAGTQYLQCNAFGNASLTSHMGDATVDAKKGTASLLSLDAAKTAKVECKSADEKVSIVASKHVVVDAGPQGDIRLSAGGFTIKISSAGIMLTKDAAAQPLPPNGVPPEPQPRYAGPSINIATDAITMKATATNLAKLTNSEVSMQCGPANSIKISSAGIAQKGAKINDG